MFIRLSTLKVLRMDSDGSSLSVDRHGMAWQLSLIKGRPDIQF